ncbi:hypothetical protein [Algoriphagus litoralis]|uniref:hypothetical protein n=1 Tax=Algoriphagus litoralis TaxID=2202829 RepID=UPI000DBA7296|nr:hypothetical protein [Algoriphagus litoralis]
MDPSQKSIDLHLWLNKALIQQQNQLKNQFQLIFEAIGNSFSLAEFQKISPKSRGVKLTKGNDLLGFPYQVLDLIRDFDPNHGANVRILNWYGNGLFITVRLGKNRENPISALVSKGFSFGLSENQWDYPDLILNKNTTQSASKIKAWKYGFYHWIKEFEAKTNPDELKENLELELKKIIGILDLS